jgi:hypothetical protein
MDEIYKLFKEPNIVQSIKINRLNWLGYTRRMDESFLCKKLNVLPARRQFKEMKNKVNIAG